MTKKLELYKCSLCSNLIEVVLPGVGELACCGKPMMRLDPQKEDSLAEKHVPVIEHSADGVEIRVGSTLHPMDDNHYIEFIEVNSPDKKYVKRRYFLPHEQPILKYKCSCDKVEAREYCNVHGLFGSKDQ